MKKRNKKLMCIALALILIGSIAACLLQTDFGSVKVKDIYILTEDKQELHALAFIPKEASAENKVPVVVTSHGWLNSAELQDATCIELSRRGVMVIAMDAYNHGLSSSALAPNGVASAENGLGMVSLVKYVGSGVLNYIDLDKVGVMGHSMGAQAASDTMLYFSRLYDTAIEEAQSPDSDGGTDVTEAELQHAEDVMIIDAALPTGMNTSVVSDWSQVRCNTGVLFTTYDENGYLTSNKTAFIAGDTPEALAMVQDIDPNITSVEEGVYYGNKDDGTLRVLYQPTTTHPLVHFSPACTADIIEFFDTCWDLNTELSYTNQTFMIKEIFNLVAMIGLFMLLVPAADMLMSCPYFASLRGVEGPKLPACVGPVKRKFWIGWILGGIVSFIGAYIAIKVAVVRGGVLEPQTIAAAPTMGYVTVWTAISAVWLMVWFWVSYQNVKNEGNRTGQMIGL